MSSSGVGQYYRGVCVISRLRLPSVRKNFIIFLGTLLFSLVYQIPDWPALFQDIYRYPMIDRSVYVRMIEYYDLPVDYIQQFSFTTFFTLEFLWNYSLAYLNRDLGLTTGQIFFFIATFVLWRFSYEVVNRAGWVYLLLLFNPLVIDLAFSQLRIAFAISVLSFFWRGSYGRLVTTAAYLFCTAIHTSIILFAAIHFAANKIDARSRKGLTTLCMAGFMIAVAIGPLREMILGTVGDRRASNYDMSSTPLYLSYWVFLWGMLVIHWKKTMSSLESRYAVIILTIAASNLVFAGYPTRFIAAAFPYIIIAMKEWSPRPFSIVTMSFIPYLTVQWMYWLLWL